MSTSIPLEQQVVLITGAARGLGAELSRVFLEQGARVIVNYFQSAEAAQRLVAAHPQQAFAYQADVTDVALVKV